jgi:periplasmic divalent cation tolerance protein
MKYIVVLSTVSSKKEGEKIAKILLRKRLAACVQVVAGLQSFYVWKGRICHDDEYLLIIKSKRALFPQLEKAIRKIHSYDVPQIVAIPIVCGSHSYLKWLDVSLKG